MAQRTVHRLVAAFLGLLALPAVAGAVVLHDAAGVTGQEFAACAAAIADLDGDGCDELLVGSPSSPPSTDAGKVYLWRGGTQLTVAADRTWTGLGGEEFGRAVAAIGDVNHDGVGDFAVGAPLADAAGADAGRVYVFYGRWPLPASPDLVLEGRAAGERFGHAVAAAGDLDGDGRDDLVVGAPLNDVAGIEAGAAYVYWGSSSGLATTPGLTLRGTLAYERFGWSVAAAGNMIGGDPCLVVGAPSNGTGAGLREGAAYVFAGPDAGADLTLTSSATSTADNEFGYAVSGAGRWNGDGYDDVVVGAPFDNTAGSDAGRAELFYGGSSPDATADRWVNGAAAGDWLGFSVAGVGDVAGSAAADVVLGAPHAVAGLGSEAGLAVVFPGGASSGGAGGLAQVVREPLVDGTPAGDRFGWWVAPGGDFDGDGFADLVVAAPAGNVTSVATAGWVQVVDSSGAAVPALLALWEPSWADGGARLRVRVAAPVAALALTRVDLATGARAVVHDGPPPAGDDWTFADAGATGVVVYDLALDLAAGGRVEFAALAGPAGAPPPAPAALTAPSPNPFNPTTTLRWRAPAGAEVACRVVDLRGRPVRALLRGVADGAWRTLTWDGADDAGRAVAAGVYLIRLETAQGVASRRAVLAK